MPSKPTAAARLDALESGMAAILAAVQGNAVPVATDEPAPSVEPKTSKPKAAAKVVIPVTSVALDENGNRLRFSQAAASSPKHGTPVVYRVPRITVERTDANGGTSKVGTLTRETVLAIREMSDEDFTELVTTGLYA